MLMPVVLALTIGGLQDPEAVAFREAFAMRNSDVASAKGDPAIKKCMDMIIARLRKMPSNEIDGETIEDLGSFYSRAVADEEGLETDFRNIGVSYASGFGRVAVGVRMGGVSRLKVFLAGTDKPTPLPGVFDWNFGAESRPSVFAGGILVVDSPEIKPQIARYAYRVRFLRAGAKGYEQELGLAGNWVEGAEAPPHLTIDGMNATLRHDELPLAFKTAETLRLFEVENLIDLGTKPFHVKVQSQSRSAIRAVDAWMLAAIKNPKTDVEKEFVNAYGSEPRMLQSSSETALTATEFEVALRFEKLFIFTVQSVNGEYAIKSFRTE